MSLAEDSTYRGERLHIPKKVSLPDWMDGADEPNGSKDPVTTDDDDFKIKGAALCAASHAKPKAKPAEDCTICLQAITERAVAVPCNHLTFDFICLVSWLQQRTTCPLCNATVTTVQYDWRSPHDYKCFEVRGLHCGHKHEGQSDPTGRSFGQQLGRVEYGNAGRQTRIATRSQACEVAVDPALGQRRRVYQFGLFSLHVGANSISQYRDFTPHAFAGSASLQSRARMFLRRELQVFTHLDSDGGVRNREFVLEYLVAVLKKFDPKGADGRAEDLLSEFLDRPNVRVLLHELHAWLRSPFAALEAWDRHVQYARSSDEMHKDCG